ncbi:MAG TPA: ABC transporter ATP-binding protein [Candidatus Saccharimonadia bacterium]
MCISKGKRRYHMPAEQQQVEEFLKLFEGNAEAAILAIKQRQASLANARSANQRQFANKEVIISAHDVVKVHRRGKQQVEALRGVSLEVHKGEFLALTGASGSGKSTLLQLLGGLDKPTSGSIVAYGADINGLKDAQLAEFRNRTVGFVFQFFYLQPFLQLQQNLEVPGMFAHTERDGRAAAAKELIARVGLDAEHDRLPKELSGGQIQRAAIARALLNGPKILLADEPTGNLDSVNSKGIIDLFQQVRTELGMTVVIVTHNPEIAAVADREITLADGRVRS